MPKYTRRHYEDVAAIINNRFARYDVEHGETGWPKHDALMDLVDDFSKLFAGDNPSFNSDRFRDACRIKR